MRLALERGFEIATGSLSITFESGCTEWRFVAVAGGSRKVTSMSDLADMMAHTVGVEGFQLAHCRN